MLEVLGRFYGYSRTRYPKARDSIHLKYLLDTDICVYAIRKKSPSLFQKISRLHIGDAGISAITYAELAFGVSHSSRPEENMQTLQEFIAPLEILDFPAEAAISYGHLRADLAKKGIPIGPLDLLIAAHALYLGITLVTNNISEFSRIADLHTENWV